MYVVYQVEKDGEFRVIEMFPSSAEEVDITIAEKEGTEKYAVHWYGESTATSDLAILQALSAGYRYRSPEEMANVIALKRSTT